MIILLAGLSASSMLLFMYISRRAGGIGGIAAVAAPWWTSGSVYSAPEAVGAAVPVVGTNEAGGKPAHQQGLPSSSARSTTAASAAAPPPVPTPAGAGGDLAEDPATTRPWLLNQPGGQPAKKEEFGWQLVRDQAHPKVATWEAGSFVDQQCPARVSAGAARDDVSCGCADNRIDPDPVTSCGQLCETAAIACNTLQYPLVAWSRRLLGGQQVRVTTTATAAAPSTSTSAREMTHATQRRDAAA